MINKLKQISAKSIVSAILLVSAIVVAGVMSFIPYIISTEKIGTSKFWTDEIISLSLVLIGFVAMMVISMNINSMSEKSEIAIARSEYVEKRKNINSVKDFEEWHNNTYLLSDKNKVIRRLMESVMLNDMSLLELDRIDIKSMEDKKVVIGEKEYPSLSKEQVEMLLKIKEGKIKLPNTNAKYYLTMSSNQQELTISEEITNETLKRGLTLGADIFFKLLLTFSFSFVLALFVMDASEGGEGAVNDAIGKFAMRMLSICSGMFSGFLSGFKCNNLEAHYIQLRNIVIDMYLSQLSH